MKRETTPLTFKSADKRYQMRLTEIHAQIAELQNRLEEHAKRQAKNKKNWALCGDLAFVSNNLEDILETFNK